MIDTVLSSLRTLKDALVFWRDTEREKSAKLRAALYAVESAALETRAYIADMENKAATESREVERKLSCLWLGAHEKALAAGEHDLADKCLIKADGWADRRMWEDPRYSGVELDLNTIIDTCRTLAKEGQTS